MFDLQLSVLFRVDFKWTRRRACQCPGNAVAHHFIPPLAVGQRLEPPESMRDAGEDMNIGRDTE